MAKYHEHYERVTWANGATALSAEHMNNIESGISDLIDYKVEVESGKGLYPDADKTKLAGIEAGAQVNPGNATTSAAGLMSASDKTKLDGVQAGAQVNPGVATTSANGLMSATDKTKLNGIEAGAQRIWFTENEYTLPSVVLVRTGESKIVSISNSYLINNRMVGICEVLFMKGTTVVYPCLCGWNFNDNGSLLLRVSNPTSADINISKVKIRASYTSY